MTERWVDRYAKLSPIRCRGAFHLYAAERRDSGSPCVVVTSAPNTERTTAAECLRVLAQAHTRVRHELVPRTVFADFIEGSFIVELDSDAKLDGVEFLRVIADSGKKVPYAVGDTIMTELRYAMQAGHKLRPSLTLGSLSFANILVCPDGRRQLWGFGFNAANLREDGLPEGWTTLFQAPEVSAGRAPDAASDYYALLRMVRALTPHVEMPAELAAVLRGEATSRSGRLLSKLLLWLERRFLSEMVGERASVSETIELGERVRSLLGVELEPERTRRTVQALVREHFDAEVEESADSDLGNEVLIGINAEWVGGTDGVRRRLGHRGALKRVLHRLAAAHRDKPGEAVSVWELVEAGWPGESPIYESALNRTYIAITRLRSLGLKEVIETVEGGYRLRPSARIAFDKAS